VGGACWSGALPTRASTAQASTAVRIERNERNERNSLPKSLPEPEYAAGCGLVCWRSLWESGSLVREWSTSGPMIDEQRHPMRG